MRYLWPGLFMIFSGILGAQRFQPGDTLTLTYRDIGQSSGYYQGLFMVDTVTANFYFFSEQRKVETGQVFGSLTKGYMGALVGTKPYLVTDNGWYLDASYDDNLATPALEEMVGFGFQDRTLIYGFGGNQLVKGPLTPTATWNDAVILAEPFVAADVTPHNNTVRSRDGYLYAASSHTLYESYRGNLQQLQLSTPDLFVDDQFEGTFPYQDAGEFASTWTLQQGTASETDVIMNGRGYTGVLADAGASFEKSFSLPLQEVPFVVALDLGLAAGDGFWATLGDAGGDVWGVGVENDSLKLSIGGSTITLGAMGLSGLRQPVQIRLEVGVEGSDTLLSYTASVSGARVVSGTDTVGTSVMGVDRIRFDVNQGRLFVDRVRVAPFYTRLAGMATTSADLLILTEGGTLYKKDATGWTRVAQNVPPARWFRVTQADPNVIWMVTVDGMLYRSVDGGASWSSVGLPASTTEARDVALSQTNPDSVLVATDNGLYVTGDGGASWSDLTAPLTRYDPEPWVRDVKSVLWEGGDSALVATGGSFFFTAAGLDSLKEFDAGLEPTYVSPAQLEGLARVLEDSSAFTPTEGLWTAVQSLVGGLGSDVDGDPRIGVILTDISHLLTSDSRVPLIDVVDPALIDSNGMECMVLDVNYAGDLVDFTQPEDPSDVQVPHALEGVVRNLSRLVVVTHRPQEEQWLVEALAELVVRGLRDGVGFTQPDTTAFSFPAFAGSYRIDVWPTTFNSPSQPREFRRYLYVFLKYLAENGVDLTQLFTETNSAGKDLVATLANAPSFGDVFLGFLRNAFLGNLSLAPKVNIGSFGTSYVSTGASYAIIDNIIPFSFRIIRFYNDYRFTSQDSVTVDSLKVNLNAPDVLQGMMVLARQRGVTQDSLEVTELYNGMLTQDTVFRPLVALYDTTASPTDGVLGDRLNLVFVRVDTTGRSVTGITLTPDDYTAPQVIYGFVQDPLADTRAVFYLFSDEPVYAERPEENNPVAAEGPWFVEVEQNEFGLYDTGSVHMPRVTSSIYFDGVMYQQTADLLSDKKWITISGEDRFGNAFPTIVGSMVLWTLRAGSASTLATSDVRLEIPSGALQRDVRVLVRVLDPSDPWARIQVGGQLVDVTQLVQVGSASIRFQRPVVLTLRLPESLADRAVRVYRRDESGWEEVSATRVDDRSVEIVTDRLGLYAVTLSTGGFVPSTFSVRLAHPVFSSARGVVALQVALPKAGEVRLALYNALGQQVALRQIRLEAGVHTLQLDGVRLLPGAYFLKASGEGKRVVERFVVIP